MANVRPACGNGQPFSSCWKNRVGTVAFYQADFGTEYLKSTRLLLKGFQTQQQTAFVKVGLVLMNKNSTRVL